MKKYPRSQMTNYVLRMRMTDLSKTSDDYLADQLILLRRMKKWLDVQSEEVKGRFKLVRGGKE